MVDVWGADHGGYIKRVQAAIKAVTEGKGDLDVKIVQLVRLLRAGELGQNVEAVRRLRHLA